VDSLHLINFDGATCRRPRLGHCLGSGVRPHFRRARRQVVHHHWTGSADPARDGERP
jgi:hypothetical protein